MCVFHVGRMTDLAVWIYDTFGNGLSITAQWNKKLNMTFYYKIQMLGATQRLS